MAVTYVQLTNELLRRLNEVPLDTGGDGFGSVRGVQALAKDAINNAIREILQYNQEWPFTLTTYTETLVSGTGTYSFQSDCSSVDWESFYLKRLGSVENQPGLLPVITYADYLRHYRDEEEISGSGAYAKPNVVYKTQDESFGVTPIPNAAYELEYKYFSFPSDLSAYTDTMIVPDRFRYVVIDGAMMYMMRFRSNDAQGQVQEAKFKKGIDDMRRILLNEPDYVTSTVLWNNFGYPSGNFKDIN